MKLFASFLAFIMLSSVSAKNIWRDCGIGALLFPSTGWAAVTSNVIWDLGTTASTSTTSSEDQCAGKGADVAKFIYQNYAMLEENTVSGQGEHLTAMLDILSCDKSSRSKIIESTRSNFAKELKAESYNSRKTVEKAESYYNILMENVQTNYPTSCQLS